MVLVRFLSGRQLESMADSYNFKILEKILQHSKKGATKYDALCFIVITTTENFFATHQILGLTCSINPSSTKSQSAKVFVYGVEEALGFGHAQGHVTNIEIFHHSISSWTTPFPVLPKVSMAYNSPSSILVASAPFTMGTDLPAWILYGAIEWPFHYFLNSLANVTQSHIYARFFYAGVGRCTHCFLQFVILGVERYSERTVYYVSIDMGSKVYFAHIVVLEDSFIAGIWRVVGCAVVERAASWEG
ncbi:hypothetical protein BpHYR1_018610 [Brachionus plicatilis]|uniref:Uncharacterized protein n=1 Tax=Brachionus plicatilis TaxID=10195 RepID=A0A3M7SK23_BRAPC|nr:hypothetical protein BpHYR1_018610 [Brachionus plicatilis]